MVYRVQIRAGVTLWCVAKVSMAARVIHFGLDDCYRVKVLHRAGYEIEGCTNLSQLRDALESHVEPDAVMMNDSYGSVPFQAIPLTRSLIPAPIVLFPNPGRICPIDQIDLIVPAFTPPQEWLLDLANLIIHFRIVRARLRFIREQSETLCRESAAVRDRSSRERLRARRLMKFRFPSPFDSNGSSK